MLGTVRAKSCAMSRLVAFLALGLVVLTALPAADACKT
jgi:hypothetical protein